MLASVCIGLHDAFAVDAATTESIITISQNLHVYTEMAYGGQNTAGTVRNIETAKLNISHYDREEVVRRGGDYEKERNYNISSGCGIVDGARSIVVR